MEGNKNLLKYFENIELVLLHFFLHLNVFPGFHHKPATRCRASWSERKWKWARIDGLGVVGGGGERGDPVGQAKEQESG